MKTDEALLEENRIIHYLMSELNGEADEAAEEWKSWENLIDQERVSRILREIFTGMLVAEGKCTEYDSKKYINQHIEEYKTKNANESTVGKKPMAPDAGQSVDDAYPPNLMQTLEAIRQSGKTNMFDVPVVVRFALEMDEAEVANWVNTHRGDYGEIILHGRPEL